MVCYATRRTGMSLLFLAVVPGVGQAQEFTQRGFAEVKATGYPQTTANDDTQVVGEALLRYEAAARPVSWLRLNGSIDAGRIPTIRRNGTGSAGRTGRSSGPRVRPSGASTPRSREVR